MNRERPEFVDIPTPERWTWRQHLREEWHWLAFLVLLAIGAQVLAPPWAGLALLALTSAAAFDFGRTYQTIRTRKTLHDPILHNYLVAMRKLIEAERKALMLRHHVAVLQGRALNGDVEQ